MKRNYIANFLALAALSMSLPACRGPVKQGQEKQAAHQGKPDTSMNYLLKPVNEQVVASIGLLRVSRGNSIYTREVPGRVAYDSRNRVTLASKVSGRIEKLYIRYNYQPVKKGQLMMEIYSPDLAAAQQELLLIQQSGNAEEMLEPAKQRLQLMGMGLGQINQVLRTRKVAYRIPVYSQATGYILETSLANAGTAASAPMIAPASGMDNMGGGNVAAAATVNPTPATQEGSAILLREGQYLSAGQSVFTIYKTGRLIAEFFFTPQAGADLKKGTKVLMQRTDNPQETFTGHIDLIQPVVNAGENFMVARVYLRQDDLLPGTLLTGQLSFLSGESYWLPRKAVMTMGQNRLVFKKEGRVFVPKVIKTGIVEGAQVQVLEEIGDWEIAKDASYLVDSESFIKVANQGI